MEQAFIFYGQYTGYSFLSKYIQFFTWSKRSHTSAFRPPKIGVDGFPIWENVIEAWHKGVTEQHWTKNHKPGTIIDIYRIPCTREQSDKFYAGMAGIKGCRYDYPGIASFFFRCCLQVPGWWFCTEAVYQKILDAGLTPLPDMPSWKMSPDKMDLIPTKQWVQRLIVPGGEDGKTYRFA